ncbi:MAG: hypothetical protein GDA48_19000 [Hormoscilla sp. GM102CHS1]|nr:hypothetical protein [Hormoscilla sp. GM102CHS1]
MMLIARLPTDLFSIAITSGAVRGGPTTATAKRAIAPSFGGDRLTGKIREV